MKVDAITLSHLSFKGYKPAKDNHGYQVYEFNYPFDSDNYDCYLEIFNVSKDNRGNYKVEDIIENTDTPNGLYKLQNGNNKVDLETSYFLDKNTPFAYHYKLVKKGTDIPIYKVDSGDIIDERYKGAHEIYNYVVPSSSKLAHGGSMKLVIPDNYNVGYQYNPVLFSKKPILFDKTLYNDAKKSYKHFSNKMGGTLAGIEKSLDNGDFDGYSNIISLPVFTDDSLSAHGYWNKNCMQIIPTLGNINNFASLQRKMFARGINFVSDGAFVNEGLEGVHFADVLKWGEKSPYYNWFKASGLKNGPFLLGVFGKNNEFVSHKIVNSPYKYTQNDDGNIKISKNRDYDSKKPTYVQIFDSRLVSEKQKNDTKNLIKSYDILNTKNPYEINTHDDTVVNYYFEVDPYIYNKNVKNLNEYNASHSDKIMLEDAFGTKFVNKYENFELEDKIESNFVTWDANTDIAKLNYVYSHSDTEFDKNLTPEEQLIYDKDLKQGNIEVQDYVISSGKFWTQKTKDILTLYVAQCLKNSNDNPDDIMNAINQNIKNKKFPKKLNVNNEIINNILNGNYKSDKKDLSYQNLIMKSMVDFPLDSIEFGDNIVSVLASPYFTRRPKNENEIGKSKFDLPDNTLTANLYNNQLFDFTSDILAQVSKNIKQKFYDESGACDYAKYVLPLIVPEIIKFAIIKSVQPQAKVFVNNENGEIGYDYSALKETSLQSIGVIGFSPKDEAESLLKLVSGGINKISANDKEKLINALTKSLNGTNANTFALADMIIDNTQAGLDWRIDATKDIADIDSIRDGKNDFGYTWQQVNDFWKKFNDAILNINNNAYIVAEVTDEMALHNIGHGGNSRFEGNDIIRKFLNETGMNATANYNNFFTDMTMLFGKRFECNNNMEYPIDDNFQERIYQKLIGNENYLRTSNLNSLLYSYTFIGNHDKPRALHCFALDMNMFFADLTNKDNRHLRERAYRVLTDNFFDSVSQKDINKFDFSGVSPKAVAMAETIRAGFIDSLNELSEQNDYFKNNHQKIFKAISKSVNDLVNGEYLDSNFDADAFAVKPFDVNINAILEQAKYKYDLDLNYVNELKDKTFQTIVEPAFSRLLGAMKYLVALPGKPTLFSGDDLGATGYETPTKNIYLQNRTYLHNEWKEEKPFVKEYYDKLNEVMAMRSRPELDALNNGAPFVLPIQKTHENTKVTAILRQNTDGKMAISLFNTSGIQHDKQQKYYPATVHLNNINLDEIDDKVGIRGGLKEGACFVNANNPDEKLYVHKYGDSYRIEHHDKSPIEINDSTLILYHVPNNSQVCFTGKVDFKPLAIY